MARKATGQVIEPDGDRQPSWALRFRAYGKRRFVTLGRPEDGWNREKAEESLRHTLADVERGIWQPQTPDRTPEEPKASPTFHEFASEWFAGHEAGWKQTTRDDYYWALHYHLLPFFADFRLSEIDAEKVDRYAAMKQREGKLSNNSINKTITRLSQILETALDYEKIARNPAKGKKRRLKGEARLRPQIEVEQLPALLEACSGAYRILIATMAGAGLRIGEAMALRWRDVSLATGTIRVMDSKTEAGLRVVDLPDGLASELRLHKARTSHNQPEDFVFRKQTDGRPQNVRNAQARLKPAIRKANRRLEKLGIEPISEDVSPHSLRRLYATLRFALDGDAMYVAEQGGWEDPSLPMRIYARAMKRRARLSGAHLEQFDRALEWAGMGREALDMSEPVPAIGSTKPVAS